MRTTYQTFFVCFILSWLWAGCAEQEATHDLTAMSFNIRYANPSDGPHVWENRKDWIGEIIRDSDAQIVGLQEALRHQIDTLAVRLPDFAWTGNGRTDGGDGGEFSPIFFSTIDLKLLDSDTFWLSPWPDSTGSVGWDAALPRIVTWAHFMSTKTGNSLFHFNTHFDHRGTLARHESAKLIRLKIQEIAGDSPFVLTGDFNTTEIDPPYQVLVADEPSQAHLLDSYAYGGAGDLTTFRGFEIGSTQNRRIDYVFTSPRFHVKSHSVVDEARDGSYPSDHLPVVVVIAPTD